MVYDSLTKAPRNLKEGLDWLMALKGTGAENNLAAVGAAVYKFLADKPVAWQQLSALKQMKYISKKFVQQEELKDLWPANELLQRFEPPVNPNLDEEVNISRDVYESDYKRVIEARGVTAETMANNLDKIVRGTEKFLKDIQIPNRYKSAYSSKATWDTSCAKDPEACAAVFVGSTSMLYAGVLFLLDASRSAAATWADEDAEMRFRDVLKAVGYNQSVCRDGISGSDTLEALGSMNTDVLDIFCDFATFWTTYGARAAESGEFGDVNSEEPVEEEPLEEVEEPIHAEEVVEVAKAVNLGSVQYEEPVRVSGLRGVKCEGPVKAVDPVEQPAAPVKPVKLSKPMKTADAVDALNYCTGKHGSHLVAGRHSGVDMGLLHAWNAKKSNKPPKIFTGVGSNNFHVPGAPAVANLDYGSPI
ncbi:Probable serine threonine- kinase kinX, putative [Babesia ovata]|uniref:Probable serine threonine-kinase kinX, putative n=1 Tax=Babesia ovata TaxID=189622 RepID=A0A2H6K731_9APIC|nr:Probable serine threonine- kinase kinX, putative [Babesia ovata]GBE58789.1 Probable serine threonine- kinase kinX, putative [Babesia ovata]